MTREGPNMRAVGAALVILALGAGLPLAASSIAGAQEPGAAAPAPAALYRRLGGYDSLAVLTDDFMGRMARDPSLSRFFAASTGESMGRIRQLLLDQLCAASGGPCLYVGRDMRSAHRGLGIREADWATTIGHLIASLDRRKIAQKEKDEVLAIASGLKRDIVEKP
jgi:hemoglobin